jgi:hypothetical protein
MHYLRFTTIAALGIGVAACTDGGAASPQRVLTAVSVSLEAASLEVGQRITATIAAFDQDGAPIASHTPDWSSAAPAVASVDPASGRVLAVAPGTTRIVAIVNGVVGERAVTVFDPPPVRINEIEPAANGTRGWVELFNPTAEPIDVSGWTLNDDTFLGATFTITSRTTIAAGGFVVLEGSSLPFVLDATDDVRLFSRFGAQVDRLFWTVPSATPNGRCPDGTDVFVPTSAATKGTRNACATTQER